MEGNHFQKGNGWVLAILGKNLIHQGICHFGDFNKMVNTSIYQVVMSFCRGWQNSKYLDLYRFETFSLSFSLGENV
jgi:hypothetical protein